MYRIKHCLQYKVGNYCLEKRLASTLITRGGKYQTSKKCDCSLLLPSCRGFKNFHSCLKLLNKSKGHDCCLDFWIIYSKTLCWQCAIPISYESQTIFCHCNIGHCFQLRNYSTSSKCLAPSPVSEGEEEDKRSNMAIGMIVLFFVATSTILYMYRKRRELSESLEAESRPRRTVKQWEDISTALLLQLGSPEANKIALSLQIAECEMFLQRGKEEEAILRVKDAVLKSNSISDVVKMARRRTQSGFFIQAIILYHTIHVPVTAFEKLKIPPSDVMSWMSNRITDIGHAVKPLLTFDTQSQDIAIKYGLEYMEALFKELHEVKNVGSDVRALTEACCIHNIAFIKTVAGDYQNVIQLCEDGIACLENQFGKDASNCLYYGTLLNNLGYAQEQLQQYTEAEHWYN